MTHLNRREVVMERLLKDIIKKQAPDVIELENDTPVIRKVKKKPPKELAIKKRTLPSSPKALSSAKKTLRHPKLQVALQKHPRLVCNV